jgi:hypothetical protein
MPRKLPHDEDERLRLLGSIMDAYSALEIRCQVILAGLVTDEGVVMAADLNFREIIIKLKVLSTIPELGDAGGLLKAWSQQADAVGQLRNQLVHSTWAISDPDYPKSGVRIKASAGEKRPTWMA